MKNLTTNRVGIPRSFLFQLINAWKAKLSIRPHTSSRWKIRCNLAWWTCIFQSTIGKQLYNTSYYVLQWCDGIFLPSIKLFPLWHQYCYHKTSYIRPCPLGLPRQNVKIWVNKWQEQSDLTWPRGSFMKCGLHTIVDLWLCSVNCTPTRLGHVRYSSRITIYRVSRSGPALRSHDQASPRRFPLPNAVITRWFPRVVWWHPAPGLAEAVGSISNTREQSVSSLHMRPGLLSTLIDPVLASRHITGACHFSLYLLEEHGSKWNGYIGDHSLFWKVSA